MGEANFYYFTCLNLFYYYHLHRKIFALKKNHGYRFGRESPRHFRPLRDAASPQGRCRRGVWLGLSVPTYRTLLVGGFAVHRRHCAGSGSGGAALSHCGVAVSAPPRRPVDRQAENRQHHREDRRRSNRLHGRHRPHQDEEAFHGVGKDRRIDRPRSVDDFDADRNESTNDRSTTVSNSSIFILLPCVRARSLFRLLVIIHTP